MTRTEYRDILQLLDLAKMERTRLDRRVVDILDANGRTGCVRHLVALRHHLQEMEKRLASVRVNGD